ncbi:MAG: hypothetical protein ACYDA4_04740 [Ignavibacteriaceae bacterium]
MIDKFNFIYLMPGLHNKDEFFDKIFHETKTWNRILLLTLLFTGLTFIYGVVMGCYSGLLQALTAGIKVPVLFILSLLICFPAFFVLQFILGSKMQLTHMIIIILSGFVLTAAIMVSFAPIVVLFVLTGGNYYFLQLLHIAIFALAGIFGMKIVLDALKYSCEQKDVYPKIGVEVFRFWVVILAFVGIQLAWNMQPFLADKTEGYSLFKKYKGNFYAAVIYSIQQLTNPVEKTTKLPDIHIQFFHDTTKVVK